MVNKLVLTKTGDYSTEGKTKLAVVLIHGIASDSSTYNKAIKYLREEKQIPGLRLVTFDLLGSGKSLSSDELNYDYDDQLTALSNSIAKLKLDVPVVLVGHSMGTFITTRYAAKHPKQIKKLILISPPVYTKEDLANPAMKVAIDGFSDAISKKDPNVAKSKAFKNEMNLIVLDKDNYDCLANIKLPTVLIYGELDRIIASHNIPELVKGKDMFTVIKTPGTHGILHDKYAKVAEVIEETLKEK